MYMKCTLQKQDCCFDNGLVTIEVCNVGVLLNEHIIWYSHNKNILLGVTNPF